MPGKIKRITFGTKNCERFGIESKYIGNFTIDGITTVIARMGCNLISDYKTCKDFFIEILPDGNQEIDPFQTGDKTTVFKRLQTYPDITSVGVDYEDGTHEEIYVPWDDLDESGRNNKYQSYHLSKNGALYLRVSKEGALDAFYIDEVETKGYADFYFNDWFN